MTASAQAISIAGERSDNIWIHSRAWDLKWISLSVVLVAMPYLAYLVMLGLQDLLRPLTDLTDASPDSLSRNLVNGAVALLVGGPHMYATFTRTIFDHNYARKHRRMLWSSLLIPVVVITLALLNLTLLLTIFFFWASIHVLHQIIYVIQLYNQKGEIARERIDLGRFSRYSDYAVVLTSLYPLAAWRVANHSFMIGENDLGGLVSQYLPVGMWMFYLTFGIFALAVGIWLWKSWMEYRSGRLHLPKTLFIGVTVTAAFCVPLLGNLDTAFQGMNVWHSFQYLALTWMLAHIRQKYGLLQGSPFAERLAESGSSRRYYLFNIGLTAADVLLAVVIFAILRFVAGMDFDGAFDRAYYIAVLSFLWIHYYHDHHLFTWPQAISPPGGSNTIPAKV